MKTLVDLFNDSDFEPEYLLLELTNGKTVSGIIVDERIDMKSRYGRKIYLRIRHQDGVRLIPATVMPFVGVNRYCSIALEFPLDFSDNRSFINIIDCDYQDWYQHAVSYLQRNTEVELCVILEFVNSYWENLESDSVNKEQFEEFNKE